MAYTLQDVQNMVRNDPAGLTGAPGNLADATYRIGGGNTGFSLNYSPEWMAAVNDTTPYQQGDSGYFWSSGDQTVTPSALKAAQLAGTANPADYITGFNYIPEISSDDYMGYSKWDPGFAGFIANLAPMVISSGIGAGISSIGGWGNLLDSISSGLSGGYNPGAVMDSVLGDITGMAPSAGGEAFTDLMNYPSYNPGDVLDSALNTATYNPGDVMDSVLKNSTAWPSSGLPYGQTMAPAGWGTGPVGSSFTSYLSDLTGIPSSVLSGIFGGAGALSQILGRNAQNAANQQLLSSNRSPAFSAHLAPTAFAGPGRGKSLGQVMRYARGGLAQANEFGQGEEYGWGDEANLGYARGGTAGQDDKVPAMLSHGEYVIDADTVAALGDGNNEAGAGALDRMRENIRRHKRSAPPSKIPPKAKAPEQYLKGAK